MIFNIEYFITKFMGIPIELWDSCSLGETSTRKCVLGHCGVYTDFQTKDWVGTEEAYALVRLFGGEITLNKGLIEWGTVYRINDNHRLEGGSERGRILKKLFELSVPLHKHDCDKCTYLGRFKESDLYYCLQIEKIPTLIARHGVGGNYSSGFQFGEAQKDDMECEMGEAWRRAAAIGLIK